MANSIHLDTRGPTSVAKAPTLTSTPQPQSATSTVNLPTYAPSPSPTPLPTLAPSETPVPSPTATATPSGCQSAGYIESSSINSVIAGEQKNFRIYIPPCYGEDGKVYPTLYMFHGSASTDSHWDDLGLDEAAEALILSGAIPPLLIVMPDGGWLAQNTSGGPSSFEGFVVNELIPHIEHQYCAWPDPIGRALGGLSRGGYWSLEIAFRNPNKFASVGAHSAALLDLYAGPDTNPQYTGVNNVLGDLRIYFDVGMDDWYITNFRQLHQDLEQAGKSHIWALNEGSHEDPYWASHVIDYLTWYSEPWSLNREGYPLCSPR